MSQLYKNPPLIEAVFEIRFPPELSIEAKRDKYYNKIKSEFPEINPPLILSTPEVYALKSYLFRDRLREKAIQYTINRFSFHRYKYLGFNAFKEEALGYIRMFIEHYGINFINRTGLRYVDHIPILKEEGFVPLKRYLNFGYKAPSSIPDKYEGLNTLLLLRLNEGRLRILIQYLKLAEEKEKEVLILDFDYFYEGEFPIFDIEKKLDESHKHTKQIFEDLITEEYKAIMNKE